MPKADPVCCGKPMQFIGRASCSAAGRCETIDWYYCERCTKQKPLLITKEAGNDERLHSMSGKKPA